MTKRDKKVVREKGGPHTTDVPGASREVDPAQHMNISILFSNANLYLSLSCQVMSTIQKKIIFIASASKKKTAKKSSG